MRGRVVVAGGAGYVGSHLAERLLGWGHEVPFEEGLPTTVDHVEPSGPGAP